MHPPSARLHHVGFVVASIAQSVAGFAADVGASPVSDIILDPLHRVNVLFLASAVPSEPMFELVEPGGEHSPVSRFVAQGGGLHHVCYEVDDLTACLDGMRASGAVVLRPPRPAVAFNGRRIAWVFTGRKLLVEYLERSLPL